MNDEPDENSAEPSLDPANRAREKSDEYRMHAELAAVFEGPRKYDAEILPKLDANLARDIQRAMAKLEKSKLRDSPVLPETSNEEAAKLLGLPVTQRLSTNDYHISRRPGEVMIVRWLAGAGVETFYERIQAHFDAGFNAYREEEKQAKEWKQDPETLAFLKALEAVEIKMTDRYLREVIRKHNCFVLSTQTADEINIAYLAEHIMGLSAEQIVGQASAPPDVPTESDLAWFFKLFALRGMDAGVERLCFFTYLQKSDEEF